MDETSPGRDRWPDIGEPELIELWVRHAPSYVKLDPPLGESLLRIKVPFLTWLEGRNVDIDKVRFTPPAARFIDTTKFRSGPRVRLEGVHFSRYGLSGHAKVMVSLRGRQAEGSCSRNVLGENILDLPAEAAFIAVRDLLPAVDFAVETAVTLQRVDATGGDVAVVIAKDASGIDRFKFVGACPIMGSTPEAGAKAALDAINRHAEIAASAMGALESN